MKDLPRDRDIILYCTCPSEASAARVAKVLMNHGFKKVRPLHGGLDAWRAAGYAVATVEHSAERAIAVTEAHRITSSSSAQGSAAWPSAQGSPARPRLRITIIDQRNHHLFQPLLYQVGTAAFATSEIAWPIRQLVRKRKEVTTLLAVVTGIDIAERRVLFEDGGRVHFDTPGARHRCAPRVFRPRRMGALRPRAQDVGRRHSIRRRILLSLERAERETDPARRAALLTFVIVGGGPTGVELAGAIAELAHQNLRGGISVDRHAQSAGAVDRGGSAHAAQLRAGPVRLCPRGAGAVGRGGRSWDRP